MELIAIVTALALIEYMAFSFRVGRARGTYDVAAPATSGHEIFDRHFRVQQNTMEQLIIFLPALWIFATYVDPTIAAGLGVAFIVGRALFGITYVQDPGKRTAGFLIGFLANVALVLGALGGAISALT
jgi:glutathione S-transferase